MYIKYTMKRVRDLSPEEKQEIIEFAKTNGVYPAYHKYTGLGYKIYPDTIKYWITPSMREKKREKGKVRYNTVLKNNDTYKEVQKEYAQQRKDTGIARSKWLLWYNKNKEHRKRVIRQKRIDNLQNIKAILKEKHKHYMESTTLVQRRLLRAKYYTAEKKIKYLENCRERYNTDPLFKLRMLIRNNINRTLQYNDIPKDHPSIMYLGCSIEEFKLHIESKFKEGMSWSNHGRGEMAWHLDHIIPLATLKDINDQEKLKEVCHYTNYQPLWELENLSKGSRIDD